MKHTKLNEDATPAYATTGENRTVEINVKSQRTSSNGSGRNVSVMDVVALTCVGAACFALGYLVKTKMDGCINAETVVVHGEEGSQLPSFQTALASVEPTSLKTTGSNSETSDGETPYLTGDIPPNIVFFLADDLGWGDISAHGSRYSTPAIDSVLTNGVEFTQFHTHSHCTPSRVAFLTGRFAWKIGVQYPEVIKAMMTAHIPEDETTFAEVTKGNGYDNYYVGRWGAGYASWSYTPMMRGWDKFFGYFGPEGGYYNHSTDHFTNPDDSTHKFEWPWNDVYDMWDMYDAYIEGNGTYSEDMFYDKAVEYLHEAKATGKPFTLTYASQTPHNPIDDDNGLEEWLNPPVLFEECNLANLMPGFTDVDLELYSPREYYCNKVKYLDMIWGNLIQTLKDLDLWDNTLIIVTSDNGADTYGEKSSVGWGSNWPLRGEKVTHLEGSLRVPCGMDGGLVPDELRGTTMDGLTHITDLAATAMRLSMTQEKFEAREALGLGLAGNMKKLDGLNMFAYETHDLLVYQVYPQMLPSWIDAAAADYALTDGEWKLWGGISDDAAQDIGWYKEAGYGMIDSENNPEIWAEAGGNCTHGCLFHLPTDPNEMHDLSGKYPEIVDYFEEVVQSIWRGNLDDDYHPGQFFSQDYRGWNPDNIMRPYITQAAKEDYDTRKSSREKLDYTYDAYPLTWDEKLTIVDTANGDVVESVASGRANLTVASLYSLFGSLLVDHAGLP